MAHVWTLLGHRKNGQPIYLAMGAEDNPPAPEPVPAPQPPAPADDKGFPENTPTAEMTDKQQAAYYKTQARKHEDRDKALGVTPEQLAELRAKAERTDKLDYELGSEADKRVADAEKAAKESARAETLPQVISARLDAAAARAGIADEDLAKAVEFIDTQKFVAKDGSVDTDKVKAFIATITPAKGNPAPGQKGPTPFGTGRRGPTVVAPGDGARAALAARGIKLD